MWTYESTSAASSWGGTWLITWAEAHATSILRTRMYFGLCPFRQPRDIRLYDTFSQPVGKNANPGMPELGHCVGTGVPWPRSHPTNRPHRTDQTYDSLPTTDNGQLPQLPSPRRFSSASTFCTMALTSLASNFSSAFRGQPPSGSAVRPCSASRHCSVFRSADRSRC